MKFRIKKTSAMNLVSPNEPPYVGAKQEMTSKGLEWVIELSSFNDLIEMSNNEGDIIINTYGYAHGYDELPEIEIYDTYRE